MAKKGYDKINFKKMCNVLSAAFGKEFGLPINCHIALDSEGMLRH